ncbi:hypothetical protein K470DRAFT_141889 [Piedraia hortae CBS 480.64]|uniref:Uncharacterized protein n=1 Tax=Piedraia hortae CBS 480.64 TaxID=1314780 RepID=A0A6A7C6V2_9PEZI|nr:hypothetical protein K470DRAFT_141889 [Piedraia hortae CBS 480.64]
METIKQAIGLTPSDQEGREPVSGLQGLGTATQPYDAGNQRGYLYVMTSANTELNSEDPSLAAKSAQQVHHSGDANAAPSSPLTPTNTQNAFHQPQSNLNAQLAQSGPAGSGGPERPTIGSPGWFQTASSGAAQSRRLDDDVAPEDSVGSAGKVQQAVHDNSAATTSSAPPANASQMGVSSIFTTLNPFGGTPTELESGFGNFGIGSTDAAEERQGVVESQANASKNENYEKVDRSKDRGREMPGSNPSAIPLAGGKPVGSGAQSRRRTEAFIPFMGSEDSETARNTQANIGQTPKRTATESSATSPTSPTDKSGRRRSILDKFKGMMGKKDKA